MKKVTAEMPTHNYPKKLSNQMKLDKRDDGSLIESDINSDEKEKE